MRTEHTDAAMRAVDFVLRHGCVSWMGAYAEALRVMDEEPSRDWEEEDATLAEQYYDGKGNYCVIGGLLHAAKYPMRKLSHYNDDNVNNIPDDAQEKLLSVYGLELDDCEELQNVNDRSDFLTDDYGTRTRNDIRARRKALLAKLKEL